MHTGAALRWPGLPACTPGPMASQCRAPARAVALAIVLAMAMVWAMATGIAARNMRAGTPREAAPAEARARTRGCSRYLRSRNRCSGRGAAHAAQQPSAPGCSLLSRPCACGQVI